MASGYPRSLAEGDELRKLIREGGRLAGEIAALRDQIKMRSNRVGEISAQVRELVPDGEKEWLDEGTASVKFGVKWTFDADRFTVDYPPGEHPYLYQHKPAVTAIRHLLPEDESSKYYSAEITVTFAPAEAVPSYTTTNKEN